MIQLRTLGETDLRSSDDGRHLQSVLAQPKRFALLVYLSVEHPGGLTRRDSLLGVFWPEFTQSRARAALRKSLYHLRCSLGDEVVVSRGDEEVGIDRSRLRSDVAAFEKAVRKGRLEEALEIYGGEFLPGFHLSDVPEFERWRDGLGMRLRREAARAARRLEERAEAGGALAEAMGWARRALEIDPFDEEALRRLLVLLDRAGNRAEAARTWERFTERLESELGVEPAPETRQVAERIRSRRAPAAVAAVPPAPVGAPASPSEAPRPEPGASPGGEGGKPPPGPRGPNRSAFGWRAALVGLGVLGAAGLAFAVWPDAPESPGDVVVPGEAGAPERVLVADFGVEGADTLLADAVSEALRIGLAQAPGVTAVSRASVGDVLRRMRRSPGERLDPELAREVAIREGIAVVVTGRLRRAGGGYVIGVGLLEAESGDVVDGWLETPRDSAALGPAIARLAAGVGDKVRRALLSRGPAEGGSPRWEVTTPSLPALRKYLQAGRAAMEGDFVRAAGLADEAVTLDPGFAAGHLKLSIALSVAYTSRGREMEALSRAFRLREQLPEPERHLIAGSYHRMAGDLPSAVEALRNAMEVSGGRVGHVGIGLAMLQAGHLEEAERIFREGGEAARHPADDEMVIRIVHRRGRTGDARELLPEAEREHGDHPFFAELRVELALAAGEYAEADSLAALIPLGRSVGLGERHPLRHRAVIDAIRGRYQEALRHLEELRSLQLARDMREPAWNTTIFAGRLHLARGAPEAGVAEVEAFLERVPPDSLHPLGRPFIYLPLADFYAEAGRPERARTFLEAYDRVITPEFRRPGRARRHLVEAKLLAAAAQRERALEELSRALADIRLHGQFDYDLPIQVPVTDRPEVARLYAAAGLPDSALAVYQRYLANRALRRAWLDAHELGAALERVAELHAAAAHPGAP